MRYSTRLHNGHLISDFRECEKIFYCYSGELERSGNSEQLSHARVEQEILLIIGADVDVGSSEIRILAIFACHLVDGRLIDGRDFKI